MEKVCWMCGWSSRFVNQGVDLELKSLPAFCPVVGSHELIEQDLAVIETTQYILGQRLIR